jgi:hypothetical protein
MVSFRVALAVLIRWIRGSLAAPAICLVRRAKAPRGNAFRAAGLASATLKARALRGASGPEWQRFVKAGKHILARHANNQAHAVQQKVQTANGDAI